MTKFLSKIVAWITAGYPEGVPGPDRVPLFALLRPRLTDDEVRTLVRELARLGESGREIDDAEISRLITQMIGTVPTADEIERVRTRLATQGWPLDDSREPEPEPEDGPADTPTDTPENP
ncbi:DUF3349 domain-containing protein [Mycolicibacterium phlei]|uniref:DUF3349 domain-containing protein n=1 Tax=Mycolicibacterium phlei TaxID=1771 RepID=UPI00025AEB58|nr:DUF3349 domain-containing protein [Mycolicibacterium phlei]EID16150.1 hypothetical protein MPHLEI_06722 [Mycolicibacterium phlei RIVM601174]